MAYLKDIVKVYTHEGTFGIHEVVQQISLINTSRYAKDCQLTINDCLLVL